MIDLAEDFSGATETQRQIDYEENLKVAEQLKPKGKEFVDNLAREMQEKLRIAALEKLEVAKMRLSHCMKPKAYLLTYTNKEGFDINQVSLESAGVINFQPIEDGATELTVTPLFSLQYELSK